MQLRSRALANSRTTKFGEPTFCGVALVLMLALDHSRSRVCSVASSRKFAMLYLLSNLACLAIATPQVLYEFSDGRTDVVVPADGIFEPAMLQSDKACTTQGLYFLAISPNILRDGPKGPAFVSQRRILTVLSGLTVLYCECPDAVLVVLDRQAYLLSAAPFELYAWIGHAADRTDSDRAVNMLEQVCSILKLLQFRRSI